MARIRLKEGADPLRVAEELKKVGITMHRRLADGSYVAFMHHRHWMVMNYPALADLYEEDRHFWKDVRRRTRAGEEVSQSEIKAHAEYFKRREQQIIASYETDN